jgi:hypothetical protein
MASVALLLIGAVAFIAIAAKHLPSTDVWCILYPSLRHFLRSDVKVIDEQSLLTAMKPPVRFITVLVQCEFQFVINRHRSPEKSLMLQCSGP